MDQLCAERRLHHKLTRPYRPQTNGLVERFNRRIGDHLAQRPKRPTGQDRRFLSHEERNRYILDFVEAYNHTRLRCLAYKAPLEALANLSGHNTWGEVEIAQRFRVRGRSGTDRPLGIRTPRPPAPSAAPCRP
ncbi:MAG: integrase core domain-containing protein [Inquilinus sp.]|uniref:integrase core domain-containing protein n=1 Tax=Inquilinus sp. TaxID=1932117 RepID=UPI003F3571F5